jgi:hypothetical protein
VYDSPAGNTQLALMTHTRTHKPSRPAFAISDDQLSWLSLVLAFVAMIVLDRHGSTHRWHAAIVWTNSALYGVAILGRRWWTSGLFWAFWIAALGFHVAIMWLLFGLVLPRLLLGTLYVIPLAVLEAFALFAAYLNIAGKVRRSTIAQNKNPALRRV